MPRNGSGVYSLPPGSTFVPNTLAQSSVVNGINNDLATDLNTPRPIVAGGTGASTVAGAQAALGIQIGVTIPTSGFLYGLTTSNNVGDATNSIDIAIGAAATDAPAPTIMNLSTIISKSVAAGWALGGTPGTPVGGLDTGAVANGTYHVWLIQRSDTGVVDALLSASATAPTMPSPFDRKRRIGSILRETAVNVVFRQFGDTFQRAPVNSLSSTGNFANTLIAFNVPSGIVVQPLLSSLMQVNSASNVAFSIGSAWSGTSTIIFSQITSATVVGTDAAILTGGIFTNTSGQIWCQRAVASGTALSHSVNTNGWIDTRGRI